MVARPTQTDHATTALELLREFTDTPSYRALGVEQQCHVQEALEHLLQYEAAAPAVLAAGEHTSEPDTGEVRTAARGEFTSDLDVN